VRLASAEPALPYILASRHPNGAMAIAFLGRVSAEKGYSSPWVAIEADVEQITGPVELFGCLNPLP
jgi:hypothetical protein